ncbi:hypothetical protein M885DRAFT_587326 [Pelagophyceae sp. CCMP2097]|nr:hypothetical protein M885DRAFT_587326 [Pelagophyceae sp. CCMP2097]
MEAAAPPAEAAAMPADAPAPLSKKQRLKKPKAAPSLCRSAGVLVYCDGALHLATMKKNATTTWAADWGGKVERGDATPHHTAVRELYEESGLVVSPEDLFGPFETGGGVHHVYIATTRTKPVSREPRKILGVEAHKSYAAARRDSLVHVRCALSPEDQRRIADFEADYERAEAAIRPEAGRPVAAEARRGSMS